MTSYCRQNLEERGMDVSLYSTLVVDEEECAVTFGLYNLSGQLMGYQQYRPNVTEKRTNHPRDSRYFTYRRKQTTAMFGLESLYFRKDILFVQEGVFDVVKLHRLGIPTVAILSSKDTQSLLNLKLLGRKMYCICDGDEAGRLLAPHCRKSVVLQSGVDAGDLSIEETYNIVQKLLT